MGQRTLDVSLEWAQQGDDAQAPDLGDNLDAVEPMAALIGSDEPWRAIVGRRVAQ